ncbi:Ribokinase-like protein [Infundibulicybe gibba]|nr:Ribokinase-like protein [Infundibulicybe gibba]
MSPPVDNGRILSIQSHVAYGYVGGKAAVFPLQCLGYDVDVINTVNYSNHSGYGRLGGTKTTATELTEICQAMERNELLVPNRLITGYIPGAEGLSAVGNIARKLRGQTHELIYLLDPVIGDAGQLYVAADVIPVYREMLHLATIITPNWFEAETLTDVKLKDIASLQQALRILHHDYHVPNVVISSIPLDSWLSDALPQNLKPTDDGQYLLCISSSSSSGSPQPIVHAQYVRLLPGYFSGVGDLFSALLLAHFDSTISHAASLALDKTHRILQLTHEYTSTLPEEDRLPTDDEEDTANLLRKTRRMKGRELRLIQGQNIIRGDDAHKPRAMEPWTGFWDVRI